MLDLYLVSLHYFSYCFMFAFAFGTIRELLFTPLIGKLCATLLESPFFTYMIYRVSTYIINYYSIDSIIDSLIIGIISLCLQQIMEFAMYYFNHKQKHIVKSYFT